MHIDEVRLAGFLDRTLPANERGDVERHLASCRECLDAAVSAHESVAQFKKKRRPKMAKKINPYLVLSAIFFALSFLVPRFFIQSLVATLIFGMKWVADSRSARMLVMVYDAWKNGGEKEASRVLGALERSDRKYLQ